MLIAAGVVLVGFAAYAQPALVAVGTQSSNNALTLYDVNPNNGVMSNPRIIGKMWAIGATANGTIYGVESLTKVLGTINVLTGAQTPMPGGTPGMTVEGDLAVDPVSGLLYGVDGQGELFVINTATATKITIGTIPAGINKDFSAIAFDSSGRLYAADTMASPNGMLVEVDKNTASVVRSVSFNPSPGGSTAGMAFDPISGKLYIGTGSRFSRVDPITGAVSFIANLTNPNAIHALAFVPSPTATSCPCYPCLRPPDGMTLWLPLDEATVSAPSSNVFGAAGVRNGGYVAPGVVGNSACLNGTSEYVTIPSYLIFGNDFSIDAWVVRYTTTGSTIFDKRTGAGSSAVRGVRFYFLPNGALGLEMGSGGLPVNVQSPANAMVVPVDLTFHHVAVTVTRRSATGGRMYIDGTLVHTFSTMAPAGGGFANASQIRIGADSQTVTNGFNGCLDEFEVFNRALDPQEVDAIYRAGRSGKCRVFGLSPSPTQMCKAPSVQQQHRICNAGVIPQTITYSFTAQPRLGSCNAAGPANFAPAFGGPMMIPAGQCATITVTVSKPPAWPASVSASCYRMFAFGSWGSTQTTGVVTNTCSDSILQPAN